MREVRDLERRKTLGRECQSDIHRRIKTRIERDIDREAEREREIGVDLGAMRRVSGPKVGSYMYVYLFASGTVNYDE